MQPPMVQAVEQLSITTDRAEWEFPPARPTHSSWPKGTPSRFKRIRSLGTNPREVEKAKEEYEDDKFAKSAVESVRSRLAWWRKRAKEHKVAPYPLTVEHLQLLGSLLKRAGYRSAGAYLSVVKNQHIRLGHTWSNALDLELREGKRACERSIGPPQKCGAQDMQKLADLAVGVDPLCSGGPVFPREGTLCGSWWAMREVELSTARCMQVEFLKGEGCGRCVFNLPVTKTDPQALGKKRTHACACSASVGGGESLCPVKVARKLYHGAVHHGPAGAHPIPAMRPLWPSAGGQFITKSAATLTFQKLAALTGTDTRVTGHACRVTGAQAMAVAGVDIWLIQAFCRWAPGLCWSTFGTATCPPSTDVAAKVTKGLRLTEVRENLYQRMEIAVGPERAVECEEEFEQVLEAKVAEMDVTELKHENVQALIEKGMLKAVRETKVKFVLCADSGLGKLHIKKNGTTWWCGRQWSQIVSYECPEVD